MSFFSTLESDFHSVLSKIATPQVTAVVAGQIAQANLTQPATATGAEKHSLVASAISEIFAIGEALANGLVKFVFDKLAASSPAILAPIAQTAEGVLSQSIANTGAALQQKATDAATQALSPAPIAPAPPAPLPPVSSSAPTQPLTPPLQPSTTPPSPASPFTPATPPAPAPSPANPGDSASSTSSTASPST